MARRNAPPGYLTDTPLGGMCRDVCQGEPRQGHHQRRTRGDLGNYAAAAGREDVEDEDDDEDEEEEEEERAKEAQDVGV